MHLKIFLLLLARSVYNITLLGDFHETLFKLFLRFLSNTEKSEKNNNNKGKYRNDNRAWVKKNSKHENWERHFEVEEKRKNKNLLLSAVPQRLHQNFFVSIEKLNKNLCNKNE
jgi:hypothetical protein